MCHPAQRRGGIDIEQRARRMGQRTQPGQRLGHRGRGIAVHRGDQARRGAGDGLGDGLSSGTTSPHGASTVSTRAPMRPQISVSSRPKRPKLITSTSSPGATRLTSAASIAARAVPSISMVQRLVGAEHRAIECHDLVHVAGHFGVELPQQVGRHRAQHARVGVDRAGAHQQALGRVDFAEQ